MLYIWKVCMHEYKKVGVISLILLRSTDDGEITLTLKVQIRGECKFHFSIVQENVSSKFGPASPTFWNNSTQLFQIKISNGNCISLRLRIKWGKQVTVGTYVIFWRYIYKNLGSNFLKCWSIVIYQSIFNFSWCTYYYL